MERGLAKLPADRWATAHEFAEALRGRSNIGRSVDSTADVNRHAGVAARAGFRTAVAACGVFAALAIGAAVWGWRAQSRAPSPVARFVLTISDSARLRLTINGTPFALSHDGTAIAFLAGSQSGIYLRRLSELSAAMIPGTEGATHPTFSPDDKWITFLAGGRLRRVPMGGGPAATLADTVSDYAWADDNVLLIARNGATFWRVPLGGGPQELVLARDKGPSGRRGYPLVLPGAKGAVFVSTRDGASELHTLRFSDQKVESLALEGISPIYLPLGYLLFTSLDGSVYAVRFDAKTLKTTGAATPVLENVAWTTGNAPGSAMALSQTGTLLYVPGNAESQLVAVDRAGRASSVLPTGARYAHPRFSPSGKQLAVVVSTGPASSDIWTIDLPSKTLSRVSRDGTSDRPEWTADGLRLVWHTRGSSGNEIRWKPADASGAPEMLVDSAFGVAMSPAGGSFVAILRDSSGAKLSRSLWPRLDLQSYSRGPAGRAIREFLPMADGSHSRHPLPRRAGASRCMYGRCRAKETPCRSPRTEEMNRCGRPTADRSSIEPKGACSSRRSRRRRGFPHTPRYIVRGRVLDSGLRQQLRHQPRRQTVRDDQACDVNGPRRRSELGDGAAAVAHIVVAQVIVGGTSSSNRLP